jgi:predicted nucleic acid-binding protein
MCSLGRRRSAKASWTTRFRSLRNSPTRFPCSRMKPSPARACIGITTDAGGPRASRVGRTRRATLLHLADSWRVLERLNSPARQERLRVGETDRLARVIERDFEFLPDSRQVHDRWRSLLVKHNIQGAQVHDARLAASMYVHGVGQILTINVRDFQRFDDLRIVHPAELSGTR